MFLLINSMFLTNECSHLWARMNSCLAFLLSLWIELSEISAGILFLLIDYSDNYYLIFLSSIHIFLMKHHLPWGWFCS